MSHRAAAALWSLIDGHRDIVEITTARDVRADGVIVHCCGLSTDDTTLIGKVPVTTVAKTLLDLGAVERREVVEAAVTEAIRRRRASLEKLELFLSGRAGKGRRGAKVLRSILESMQSGGSESVLELKLVRLIRRAGLPEPVSQHSIRQGGKVVARVDLAYPSIRLAIEADGYRYHGGPGAWRRDLARRNALTALGWQTVHVTWDDVTTRPDEVIGQIRSALVAPRG